METTTINLPIEVITRIVGGSRAETLALRCTCAAFSTIPGEWDMCYRSHGVKKQLSADIASFNDVRKYVLGLVVCGRVYNACMYYPFFKRLAHEFVLQRRPDTPVILYFRQVLAGNPPAVEYYDGIEHNADLNWEQLMITTTAGEFTRAHDKIIDKVWYKHHITTA